MLLVRILLLIFIRLRITNTVMHCITTFLSMTDRIYDGGPIGL